MEDLHKVGGVPALLKYLLKNTDLIDGSQLTVTGKTIAENLEGVPELDFTSQDVVRPARQPDQVYGAHHDSAGKFVSWQCRGQVHWCRRSTL